MFCSVLFVFCSCSVHVLFVVLFCSVLLLFCSVLFCSVLFDVLFCFCSVLFCCVLSVTGLSRIRSVQVLFRSPPMRSGLFRSALQVCSRSVPGTLFLVCSGLIQVCLRWCSGQCSPSVSLVRSASVAGQIPGQVQVRSASGLVWSGLVVVSLCCLCLSLSVSSLSLSCQLSLSLGSLSCLSLLSAVCLCLSLSVSVCLNVCLCLSSVCHSCLSLLWSVCLCLSLSCLCLSSV